MPRCEVCFRHCEIREGELGFCRVRTCENGVIRAANYGKITALALDPIEKKPLRRFYPGAMILSVGSYGCNLRCPFCQNSDISWGDEAGKYEENAYVITPEELAQRAAALKVRGNIGVAYTYNEPLISYEFVLDCAKLVHEAGMKNVLVTNGTAEAMVAKKLAPYIDAMNIDLKGFKEEYYRDDLGGNRDMVLSFIQEAVTFAHVELTTLIVPGKNDTVEEMRKLSGWIAELDENIPLHISRFFPQFHYSDRKATDVSKIYRLADVARDKLKYVYTGNC